MPTFRMKYEFNRINGDVIVILFIFKIKTLFAVADLVV